MRSVTRTLIWINVAVFVLQAGTGDRLILPFALWPIGHFSFPAAHAVVGFQPWQLVTSAFLHGGVTHIGFNMLGLWMFGQDVERMLGQKRFTVLYFAAVITASLTQLLVVSLSARQVYPTIGASGGVFGVLLAFGVIFPRRIVMPLFSPIPMEARVFVTLYGALELMNGVLGSIQGVAHFAHLGGMLGAWIVLRFWMRPMARIRRIDPY